MFMPEDSASLSYKFKGIPLTPAVIELLAIELFSGKLVSRQILEEEVVQAHVSRGGIRPKPESVKSAVKKALRNLKEKLLAENPIQGHWRFMSSSSSSVSTVSDPVDFASTPNQSTQVVPETMPEIIAERILGVGPAAVYLYYLPVYRLRAEDRGECYWPCKIGRTDRDPLARVLAQAATALPERPLISMVIRTRFPVAWESALHGVLTLRGRRIEDVPGTEWFLTSPDEVYELAMEFDSSLTHVVVTAGDCSVPA